MKIRFVIKNNWLYSYEDYGPFGTLDAFHRSQKLAIQDGNEVEYEIIEKTLKIDDVADIIDSNAFKHCEDIEKIILPEGFRYIQKGAFFWATNLKEIELPNSIEKIGVFNKKYIEQCKLAGCLGDICAFNSDITVICPKDSFADEYCKHFDVKAIYK